MSEESNKPKGSSSQDFGKFVAALAADPEHAGNKFLDMLPSNLPEGLKPIRDAVDMMGFSLSQLKESVGMLFGPDENHEYEVACTSALAAIEMGMTRIAACLHTQANKA